MQKSELAEDRISISNSKNSTKLTVNHYFTEGQWGQCLEWLKHLCIYNEAIFLVSGPTGIGKTTLKQALQNTDTLQHQFCSIQAEESEATASMMQRIAAGFNLNWEESVAEDVTQLPSFQDGIKNQKWVLLIDNAEYLTPEMVKRIFDFRESIITNQGKLVVVLFAHPDFETKLLKSSLKHEFSAKVQTIELDPLTLAEMESFLLHHWRLAGNRGNIPFNKSMLKKIYKLSQGIPAEVDRLSKAGLSGEEMKPNKQQYSKSRIRFSPVMLSLTLFFGMLLLLSSFFWPIKKSTPTQAKQQPIATAKAKPKIEPKIEIETKTATTQTINPADSLLMQKLQDQIADKNNILAERDELKQKLIQLETELAILQSDKLKLAEKLESVETAATTIVQQTPPTPKIIAAKPSFQQSKNKVQKPYTIQVLAGGDKSKLENFMRDQGLAANANCIRCKTKSKNKPWYILVYGNYDTREQALKAIDKLPSSLKSLKPWPRTFASIASVKEK